MAQLSEQTTTTVLNIQRRLLAIIHQATDTGFVIMEQYGETAQTLVVLEDLQNVQDRANTYYSRFYTLLLRIAESQPIATNAMLNLLEQSIRDAQNACYALEATIQEEKRNFNLL
ncbi:MAG TPA: hypothetical protein V6C58_01860 [Allocoleopsis sp.]